MRFLILCLFLISASMAVISCTTGQTYVKFTKKCGASYASEESFEIWSGGSKIYTSPTFANNELRVIEQCLTSSTNDQYQLKMKDSYGDSWYNGAYLMIEGPYDNRIFKAFLAHSNLEEYTISLYTPIHKNTEWKLTSGTISGTWTQYNYDDSAWSSVTLGSVTASVSGTQYLRKTFTGLASMAAYEVSLNYRYGIIVYINGAEVYRDNMPTGEATPTTAATGSYPSIAYRGFVRPGLEVSNAQSVMAVEIHFTATVSQTNVDFNAFLAVYASGTTGENCYVYPYDMTLDSTQGSNAARMGDWSRSTYYYIGSTSYLPATVTYDIDGPKPFFNGVRVWPYSSATSAPRDYILQGSNSNIWNNVVTGNGIVHTNNQYHIKLGFFTTNLYSNYRFTIQASATTYVYAYEVQPLVCTAAVPTAIEFSQSQLTYYARYENVNVKPDVVEFANCQISPTPAEGLEWDNMKCLLHGKVDNAGSTVYTVTATINGQTFTGTFTLQIVECTGTVVNVRRVYTYNAAYDAYTIKDANNNVVAQVNANSGQVNNVNVDTILCMTSSKYTLTMSTTLRYWYYNAALYVNAMLDGSDDYETILRVRYDDYNGLPDIYTFNVQYAVKPYETWNYKMSTVPTNWYNSDSSGWDSGSAGNFDESENQIQLYKKTFQVTSLTDVAGVVVNLKYQYGVQIYLNNHEVFRKGFTGDLSTSTYSSTSLSNVNFRQISLPIKTMGDGTTTGVDYITTGTNTIAIALVAAGPAQKASTFDCAVRLMGTPSSSRIYEPTYTASGVSGYLSSMYYKYYSYSMYQPTCTTNNYFQFTFPDDRHEWVSSILIKLYYTQSNEHIRTLKVQGKNAEDSTWTTLKEINGLTWSIPGQSQRIWLNNNKSYNQYRLYQIGTGSTTDCAWKMGYFDLLADYVPSEIPSLSYPTSAALFKDVELSEIFPNSEYYTDFSVTPDLPTGIFINPYSGFFSGTASTESSAVTYTVSAKKITGESVTAQISLAVEVCTGGRSLITFVARTDSYPNEAAYKLYQGKGTSGTVVSSIDEFPVASALNYADFCLNHGIYTMEVTDTSTGWNVPSGYYLSVDVVEMKFEMGQVYKSPSPASVIKYFSSYLPFQVEYDDWKVFKEPNVSENWNTINFDDSAWTVTKAANIGTNEAITTYIRRTIPIDDASTYQVLNVHMRYSGGVVAYFNGRKVARFNLDELYDSETESITIHDPDTYSMFHIVLPTVGLVTGNNVIAFEIHRPRGHSSSQDVVFDATGVFGINDCSIGVDSIINVSGTNPSIITDLEDFFDLTPMTYGYQPNSVGTYLQWTVENLEGTKFNSFALETTYSYSSWGFSVYGREHEFEDDDPDAEEYVTLYEGTNQSTLNRGRPAWDAPVGIAGFRQFRHEVDDTATATIYIMAYIFQYCKAQGTGACDGDGDYPPVAEGQISPGECPDGFNGYSYRTCTNGQLGPIVRDKCTYKLPGKLTYDSERYVLVLNTQALIPAPTYLNKIEDFHLAENTFLPDGLEIDKKTGAITGVPTSEVDLMAFTIYGENPTGVTMTTIHISVRKGECKAEGNFPKTEVGTVATYDCAVAGSYVGTQRRACILGAKDGEWAAIQGTCMPIFMIILLILVGIIVVGFAVLFIVRASKRRKAVGGVKGRKSSKTSGSKKSLERKPSGKSIKV